MGEAASEGLGDVETWRRGEGRPEDVYGVTVKSLVVKRSGCDDMHVFCPEFLKLTVGRTQGNPTRAYKVWGR